MNAQQEFKLRQLLTDFSNKLFECGEYDMAARGHSLQAYQCLVDESVTIKEQIIDLVRSLASKNGDASPNEK